MSQPWKQIVRQGVCHYPEICDGWVYIVSVDEFTDPCWSWRGPVDRYVGKTWYVIVFPVELDGTTDELSVHSFRVGSSDPLPTVEAAVRRAEELVPTGITWKIHERET